MSDSFIQEGLINEAQGTVALKKGLDAWALRQRVHAHNIANAETPGYRRVVVDFEDKLMNALQNLETPMTQTDPKHLPGDSSDLESLQAQVRQEPIDPEGNGINGVDMDQEMAEMAETQLRYLTGVELLKRRYDNLKSIIRGTGQ